MRKSAITVLTAALVLSAAPAAFAQTSPADGECQVIDAYTKTCPTTEGTTIETPPSEIPTVVEGTKTVRGGGVTGGTTLPMTGAELSGLVLAGVVLVGGGTTLVVAGRRRKQQPTD